MMLGRVGVFLKTVKLLMLWHLSHELLQIKFASISPFLILAPPLCLSLLLSFLPSLYELLFFLSLALYMCLHFSYLGFDEA